MTTAMSDSATLGGFMLLAILLLVGWGAWYILARVAPKYHEKRRDQQIETAMRMGVRDQEAQRRIARKIVDEHRRDQQ